MTSDRRTFFRSVAAFATARAVGAAAPVRRQPALPDARQESALTVRDQAALTQTEQTAATHTTNGDETSLPNFIANFSKGLPHTALGEVDPAAYQTLLLALNSAKQSDMEGIQRGAGMKFVNPLASMAYQLEGADSHRLGTPPPPSLSSATAAAEMVELYWQALARDIPFANYGTSAIAQAAVADLNRLQAFQGPTAGGKVTTATLFGGNVVGGLNGPYVSQFLWQPVPLNSTPLDQRYRVGVPGVDYLTAFPEWLAMQGGTPPARSWTYDPTPRYIYNGRALAEWVHYDFLHQAFHNAALILLNQTPLTITTPNPYLNPTNPYKTSKVEAGFGTFGAPHVCCMLARATEAALKAAWFQKWLVHRRLRPEEFGGRVHQTKSGGVQYPIHPDLLNSAALPSVFAANGTYLLPQAFPEGCPLHPAYPAGHATVSGACSLILKAFFDETQLVSNCVTSSTDGLSLVPFTNTSLTVGGEVNKLAFNIAMGRNFAGIHYRTDAEIGFQLGEDVAISLLQDWVRTFGEDFAGFKCTRVDGTPIAISKAGVAAGGNL